VLDGKRRLAEGVRLIKRNTRRYAKRQLTWYRRYDEALWLPAGTTDAGELLGRFSDWP
jgi:tRNA dimethylallyltransferase